jgi:5'-methylthioadenosine phosphorylase
MAAVGDPPARADVGVFGGSGFYEFLNDTVEVAVDTPYGRPSEPVTIGEVADRRVAFLPRHGHDHRFIPTTVPYRANVWAMRQLGVTSLIAPCSAGSLQPELHPGDLVVLDQLVDRTWGRADTYHEGPPVHHQEFADPYDADVRRVLVAAGRGAGITIHDGGTVVVIQGPRFSTRAESRWFRHMGWHVVNMTNYPEAVLAKEAGLRYGAVALVTDYDAGLDGQVPVTMEVVFARMKQNVARVKTLIERAVPALP